MPDPHKNFAYSTVATAPSPATSGTSLVVASGDGSKFPTTPFNAIIWPTSAQPTTANAEIVRVTAIATDTLTITRAQESSSARTVVVGDQIAAVITAKTLTDAEIQLATTTRVFEEFLSFSSNQFSTTTGGAGCSTGNDQSQAGHPGCFRMILGANATVYCAASLNIQNNTHTFNQADKWDIEFEVQAPAVITDSNMRLGVFQYNTQVTFPPGNGAYFEHLLGDTNWFLVLRASNTQTRTDTGQAVAASTWYRLRAYYDGTDVWYSVNGGTPVNIGHTNYPLTQLVPEFQIDATSAPAASRTMVLDYVDLRFTGLSR
jgi:hypothetical protein